MSAKPPGGSATKWFVVAVLSVLLGLSGAPAGAEPFAYVSNLGDNNVTVIDTATNGVVATVTVGTQPFGVAVSPDGTRVYVANSVPGTVSVIDTATNTVVATVTVGANPRGVTVSPDGSRAYVTNKGPDNVSVINTATNTVIATVTVGFNPVGVAVTPDGTRLYVVNEGSGNVTVIDTASNTVLATVSMVTNAPEYVGIKPVFVFAPLPTPTLSEWMHDAASPGTSGRRVAPDVDGHHIDAAAVRDLVLRVQVVPPRQ